MIIPKGTFLRMNEDVIVNVLYPNTQVDAFPYIPPPNHIFVTGYEYIGYIVSTIFDGNLFYEYYEFSGYYNVHVEETLEHMKTNVKESVLKTI